MIQLKQLIGLPSLQYHIDNGLTLSENVYRYSSDEFINLFKEARAAHSDGKIQLNEQDKVLLETTDIGEYGDYNGMMVPLDLPMVASGKDPLFEIGALIDEMIEDINLIDEASSINEMIDFAIFQLAFHDALSTNTRNRQVRAALWEEGYEHSEVPCITGLQGRLGPSPDLCGQPSDHDGHRGGGGRGHGGT